MNIATSDELRASIAQSSTQTLVRQLRSIRTYLAGKRLSDRERRSARQVRVWIITELFTRYPVAKQAVRAARDAATTEIEKRGLDFDQILIDAIPATDRNSKQSQRHRGLTDTQKETLIVLLNRYRYRRLCGMPYQVWDYPLEGRQVNIARALVKTGHLKADSQNSRFPTFWFTEDGLRVAEQLYAAMGLDADLLYQSETQGPESVITPDARPAGRMTADTVAFVNDTAHVFRGCVSSYGLEAWLCRLCDDGKQYTDRVKHWKWHTRLASIVDAIDWANPTTTTKGEE